MTLPLDGRDGRSRVRWGFKKSRAEIAFWSSPHNNCCRYRKRGYKTVSIVARHSVNWSSEDTKSHHHHHPRHLPTPGQSTPCVTAIFARAAPPFKFYPYGTLWSTGARSWHSRLYCACLSSCIHVCVCVCVYRRLSDNTTNTRKFC